MQFYGRILKEIDKFNETTLEAIEEARTEEAAGTIDTSSYDASVNSISKKCGLDGKQLL